MYKRFRAGLSGRAQALVAALGTTLCLLIAFAAARAVMAPRGPTPGALVEVNLPLPAYRLTDFGQRAVTADELRSGRVLLFYLKTDCLPCLKEMEVISRLRRDAPPGLRIYGVAAESAARLTDFAERRNLTFPIMSDAEGQLAQSLDTRYFPSKYFVEDGVITKAWYGRTRDEGELRRQLGVR
ncbi:MAG TPA: TlpA disulfide reductase family protein [Pyrinomonadaceae bacterium]|jgi:peroxiredoxin